MGANTCLAVDIEEETLEAAEMNARINKVEAQVDVLHTRQIYIGADLPTSDYTVANILPGALNRLASLLWMLTKPGGIICLSGMRPHELPAIQGIYRPYVDMSTSRVTEDSHPVYESWCMWEVKTKVLTNSDRRKLLDQITKSSVEA